jgi:hypothetical protein
MAFVILEQIFVSATVCTLCFMSLDNDYYNNYGYYYEGYMQPQWVFPVFFPLMLWGWFTAIAQLYTLCKIKSWEKTGGVNMRQELMYQQVPQQNQGAFQHGNSAPVPSTMQSQIPVPHPLMANDVATLERNIKI